MHDTTYGGHDARITGWAGFWNRGGWWKALVAAVVYLALYLGAGQLIALVAGDLIDRDNLLATPASVFIALGLPPLVGGVLLVLFAWSVGWLKPLFSRRPQQARGWMWIAPALVLLAIVLRLAGIDYGSYTAGVILATFAAGLFVGFAEELLTRGIVVDLLRRHGYGEWAVMLLSTLVFALLHSANLLSGFSLQTVLLTIGFAFGFGICMYLTLRVTGTLIVPIVLHALYDPTVILATGGVDQSGATAAANPLVAIGGLSTFAFLLVALVAIFIVRGRLAEREPGLQRVDAPASA
jgi:membrane protease YdiL (CAAX protease family)